MNLRLKLRNQEKLPLPCSRDDSLAHNHSPLLPSDIFEDHISSLFSDKHAKGAFLHTL